MANEVFSMKMIGNKALIEGRIFDVARAKHLLREAIDDIADEIEHQAKLNVPEDTGELIAHPIDREDTRIGIPDPRIAAYGGGFTAQGAGGRFIGAAQPGELVARSSLSVAKKPKYAIWVHDGTGIYGPNKKPYTALTPGKYMVFDYHKGIIRQKGFRLLKVKGQKSKPYLRDAYLLVERDYVPVRIKHLRAQIKLET